MEFANMVLFYFMTFGTILITFGAFPGISRKNVLFGVSVPAAAQNDPEVKTLKRSYIKTLLLLGAVLTVLYIAGYFIFNEVVFAYMMAAYTIAPIIGVSIIYVVMWRRTKELKIKKEWDINAGSTVVADTSFMQYKISVSPLWLLIYPAIIAATLLAGYLLYDRIPGLVPMQTDFDGNVTRYAEKSLRLIYFAPVVQSVLALVSSFIYYIIRNSRPELDPENPEISAKQNAIFRRRWSAFTVAMGILMMLVFMTIQLSITALLPMTASFYISMAFTGIIVVSVIVLSITTGQSGSRVRLKKVKEGGVINRSDDKYWKFGMFYYNPEDPSLFVEKRFGIGFTNNFGRPLSWIILIGLIGFIITISIISTKLAG